MRHLSRGAILGRRHQNYKAITYSTGETHENHRPRKDRIANGGYNGVLGIIEGNLYFRGTRLDELFRNMELILERKGVRSLVP